MDVDPTLVNLISGFTSEGTPLSATIGSKIEHAVVILTAAMLANENLAASMDAAEMVDAQLTITTSFKNVLVTTNRIKVSH
jgi:chromosome condensin MukBEF complex kleisin-like MukF subunit